MLCETCGKRKAIVFYHENLDGQVRNFSLCGECAQAMKRSGELEELGTICTYRGRPWMLPEEPGLRDAPELFTSVTDTSSRCPRCGASWADVTTMGGIGCAACYKAFATTLAEVLAVPGTGVPYTGSVPTAFRIKQERAEQLASLRRELAVAVRGERFEEAATLRDRIRSMEKEDGKDGMV